MSAEPDDKGNQSDLVATVYIVDDDPAVTQQIMDPAESVHLKTACFSDATAFLEQLESDRPPACLILDVRMPGMTGLQLLEKMQSKNIQIPTIMVTAYGDLQAAVTAMKLGALDFLEKPLNMSLLLDLINKAIESDRVYRLSGKTSKVIAQDLGISLKTVEAHRARIRNKMQVDNVIELIYRVVNSRSHPNPPQSR